MRSFFLTKFEDMGRCLVGRYELGWLVESGKGDVALAASGMRFIEPSTVANLTGRAKAAVDRNLRNFAIVDEATAAELRAVIEGERDRTDDYLEEIHRLERFSHARTGFRYVSWDKVEPFTWSDAPDYLAEFAAVQARKNTSLTGEWVCGACGVVIKNLARLKVCTACKARDTLKPLEKTA